MAVRRSVGRSPAASCDVCTAPTSVTARFCGRCGRLLPDRDPHGSPGRRTVGRRGAATVGAAAAVVAIVVVAGVVGVRAPSTSDDTERPADADLVTVPPPTAVPDPARDRSAQEPGARVAAGAPTCVPEGCARWTLGGGGPPDTTVVGDLVVLVDERRLTARSATDGTWRWSIRHVDPRAGAPAGLPGADVTPTARPRVVPTGRDDLLATVGEGWLVVRDAASGALRWQADLGVRRLDEVRATAAPDGLLLLAGTRRFGNARGPAFATALDLRDGATVWTHDVRRHLGLDETSVAAGVVPALRSDGRVVGIAVTDGTIQWERDLLPDAVDRGLLVGRAPDGDAVEVLDVRDGTTRLSRPQAADVEVVGTLLLETTARAVPDGTAEQRTAVLAADGAEVERRPGRPLGRFVDASGEVVLAWPEDGRVRLVGHDPDGTVRWQRLLPGFPDLWGARVTLHHAPDRVRVVDADGGATVVVPTTGHPEAAPVVSFAPPGVRLELLDGTLVASGPRMWEFHGAGGIVRVRGAQTAVGQDGHLLVGGAGGLLAIDPSRLS